MSINNTIPSVSELTERLLDTMATTPDLGANDDGMELYDASIGVMVDPATAWNEAQVCAKMHSLPALPKVAPNEWAGTMYRSHSVIGLPLATGLFPQMVTDISRLAKTAAGTTPFQQKLENTLSGAACDRIRKSFKDNALAAISAARLGGAFDLANDMLAKADLPKDALANEQAATLWLAGEHAKAQAIWKQLPGTPAVAFNRGMAALMLGDKAEAALELKSAIAGLQDTSGWKHLAELYLSLASAE